ncbi:glycogenin-1 [Exaiptasia diaphana]|uniref:Hexosyltransferase n=1 Tax=Exaiptasia diaphana TaxID=2652724 RepID=A0A913WPC8_EXADI|nr:glycogenin-1 [Exaiptasia diaphana]
MDCEWMERRLGLHTPTKPRWQRIKGTHTRFHGWRYTNYSKIIYADPDYLLMSNIDELFEIGADYGTSPVRRPGLMYFKFSAGFSVFRPDLHHYESIMNLWESIAKEKDPSDITSDSCWDDEAVLNYYFSSIGKLYQISYAYNPQRVVYQPVRAFHFACCSPQKPWRDRNNCRPSRVEAELYDKPVTNVQQASMVFWKVLYTALKTYDIDKIWWRKTRYFDASKEFGKHRYEECWTD